MLLPFCENGEKFELSSSLKTNLMGSDPTFIAPFNIDYLNLISEQGLKSV